LVLVVLRTEDATPRPDGLELAAAIVWRGVVYGFTDGLLLAVFPILAVFSAFAGSALRQRLLGKIAIGAMALAASLGITASYHLGYSDFRSDKLGKPVAGMPLTAAPTLLTLSPLGAPIAHAAMHTAVVLHSYETDTFLPPHPAVAPATEPTPSPPVAATRPVSVYFFRGEALAPVEHVVPDTRAVGAAALRELLEGPTAAEQETGIASAVPEGSELRALTIADGVATVDLSGQFASGGGSFSIGGRLAQLVFTLTQFESVTEVELELNGEPVSVFSAEGLEIEGPLSRATYEQARSDSLEASFLPAVLVERPAQGAAFASPLRVTGTATGPFTLAIVDWDGLVIVEQAVTPPTGARTAFDVTLRFEPGLYPRGALIVSQNRETIAEIPLP
ncbi:MAG: GerMN domain-containing protein, partial [Gaiellales bacterium]